MQSEVLYWGLKFSELITLIGITVGPIVAVLISLITETKRRQRDSKIQILRMLINTRHLPADPVYSLSINLIPVEFNKDKKVMDAWHAYINQVRFKPTQENSSEHERLMEAKQTTLIFQIMRSFGFNLSETDIQTSAYVSEGFIKRDNLYLASLVATTKIAEALQQQTEIIKNSVAPAAPQKKKAP